MFSISGKQTDDRRGHLRDELVECETMMNLWDKDDEFAQGTYDPINYMDIEQLEEKLLDE